MKNSAAAALATFFGCGYSPFAPGTAGSAGALAVAVLLIRFAGVDRAGMAALAAAMILPGIWAATVTARARSAKDPGIVVIDEVIGQWITLAGALRFNPAAYLLAFLLFRAFDIFKPPPVRRLEALPAGCGIVADDVMAGIYGAVVLHAAGWFNLY